MSLDILAQGTLTQNGLIEGGTLMIAVAGHTDLQVLHAAAATEFLQHVRTLLAEGREPEARQWWASVVEFVHLPPPEEQVVEIRGLPPMQRVACSIRGCQRCLERRGGFRFPWIGPWSRRSIVVETGHTPDEAWRRYHERPERMDAILLSAYSPGMRARDFMPRAWDALVARVSPLPGGASTLALFEAYRDWQMDHEYWMDPAVAFPFRTDALASPRLRAQRSLASWITLVEGGTEFCLPAACFLCGGVTRRVCTACFIAYCAHCDSGQTCCEEFRADQAWRYDVPAMRPGQHTGDLIRRLVGEFAVHRDHEAWASP